MENVEIWKYLESIAIDSGNNEYIGDYVAISESNIHEISNHLNRLGVDISEVYLYNESQETVVQFEQGILVYSKRNVLCWNY